MKTYKEEYGKLSNDKVASLYTIENKNKMKVVLSDFGASIINIFIKDNKDKLIDVALGHLSLKQYETNSGNLGCVIGRNANRIKDAKVMINDIEYQLEKNEGNNNLHTGTNALQTRLFSTKATGNEVIFYTTIKHLEDGFPGNLDLEIKYTLSQDDVLRVDYKATSDKDTIVNITNHNYFNLNGQDESNIYNNLLQIDANFYSPNNKESLPTGEILKVDNTPFDFTKPKELGQALKNNDQQITDFNGIDHNFLLNNTGFRKVANLYNPKNNLSLDILTDTNAMHVYTANHFPDQDTINKDNLKYPLHGGIAFETQTVPNALNMPWLKSPVLKAKNVYKTSTAFKFSIK